MSAADPAIVLVDAHGSVMGWNAGAERLLGWTSAEAVGQPAAELLGPEAAALIGRGAEAPRGRTVALTLRTREGSSRDAELTAHSWQDATGTTQHAVVALPAPPPGGDLPPHQEAIVRAFDQAPFTLVLYDSDLRYLWLNDATAEAGELDRSEVIGTLLTDVEWSDPTLHEWVDHVREAQRLGEPTHFTMQLKLPTEPRPFPWSTNAWPVRDAEGRVLGVGALGFDVSTEYLARQRLTLLNQATNAIGRTLDVSRTAAELADVLVPDFADFTAVDLFTEVLRGDDPPAVPPRGPVTLCRVAQRSSADGTEGGTRGQRRSASERSVRHPPGSPVTTCLTSGQPVVQLASPAGPTSGFGSGPGLTTDPAVWPEGMPLFDDSLRDEGVHSRITVPLRARGTLLGAAVLTRSALPDEFSADDLILVEELSARAAVAVDNARRFTQERATALALQRSLLPRRLAPQSAVQVASRYLPAFSQAGVGGDWFDVIPLSGGRVALVVGDVVGHGIQASATMGRLRIAVRTLADVDLPPDELLTHLDDLVIHMAAEEQPEGADQLENDRGDLGATCLYTVYDPATGRFDLASAGHPLPVLLTPEGTATRVSGTVGPPLGIGGLPFETTELHPPSGSLLALFTDGLIRSRSRDIDTGIDALCRALERPAASLEEACDIITASLLDGHATDDVALLLARTRVFSPDQVATLEIPAEPAMVERARKFATERLAEWGLESASYITELVVSELVTNAIRYGTPPIQLRLIRDRTLVCEVSDASSTVPLQRRARVLDEGGRGLLLVAQLTQDWGTRLSAGGKTIWAEQALPAE